MKLLLASLLLFFLSACGGGSDDKKATTIDDNSTQLFVDTTETNTTQEVAEVDETNTTQEVVEVDETNTTQEVVEVDETNTTQEVVEVDETNTTQEVIEVVEVDQLGSYVFAYPPSPIEESGNAIATASIEGVVRSAASGSAMSNVLVTLNETQTTTTDSEGKYIFSDLVNGSYSLVFTATDYQKATYTQVVTDVLKYNIDALLFIPTAYTGTATLSGAILDAQTGDILKDTTINIRKGLNTKEGTIFKTETLTEDKYSIELTKGYYTLEVTKADYISAFYNISIATDTLTKDLVISKSVANDEIRVVLTWGETPSDLDSHLAKYENSTVNYHLYYENTSIYTESAKLDTDETDSYGPETVTFTISDTGTYKYYVHDYSNQDKSDSTALSTSGAKVTVYKDNKIFNYYPPSNGGTVWKVFEIKDGYLEACTTNCMTYEANSNNSATFGRFAPANKANTSLFSNLPKKNRR